MKAIPMRIILARLIRTFVATERHKEMLPLNALRRRCEMRPSSPLSEFLRARPRRLLSSLALILSAILAVSPSAVASNLTRGDESAVMFGLHEVVLTGDGSVSNPFDTIGTVTFTAPGGERWTVDMFYDGGDTWRARVYVSEVGIWQWTSSSTDSGLNTQSGSFSATSSSLRGKLRQHASNPKQWMTDDNRTFINISDTAYYLFQDTSNDGNTISDLTFQNFVNDDANYNVNSVRANVARLRDTTWSSYFTDSNQNQIKLSTFQRTDSRMEWMLNTHPQMYIQLVLVPESNTGWRYDETFWKELSQVNRTRLIKYLVARYAAWPQVFWLIQNDYFFSPSHPNNVALAQEWGNYIKANDPWSNLLSTGRNRGEAAYFSDASWNNYIHLETAQAFAADQIDDYTAYPQHVFNGEDEYEERKAFNGRYYFRWVFWSWLLSGGSANYGTDDWHDIVPYESSNYVGLDSVRYILPYFEERNIDPADWTPDDSKAWNLNGASGTKRVQVMRKGTTALLAYHPNSAVAGDTPELKSETARMRVNLSDFSGNFAVEWFNARTGLSQPGTTVAGGVTADLSAPWTGVDVVLYLKPTTDLLPAEISVSGLGNAISRGDANPSPEDGTDFEGVDVDGASLTRTFTIQNIGNSPLSVDPVTIGGDHPADFVVTAQPASVVEGGSSTIFSVKFDPSGAALRSAIVSFTNDDPDENPFSFSIQGTGDDGSSVGESENLALSGTISSVTDEQTANPSTNTIDGIDDDDGNRWSASGFPQSIEVDLGAGKTVSGTELHGYQNRDYQFTVEAKTEDGTYALIVDESANEDATPVTNTFSPVTARYIKLTVIGAHAYTGSYVAIREFKILAPHSIVDTDHDGMPDLWEEEHSLDPLVANGEDDDDFDGIPNLIEFALELDPSVPDFGNHLTTDIENGFLTLTAVCNPDASNLLIEAEVSANLSTWLSGEENVTILEDTLSLLRVRDNIPLSNLSSRLIRLKVTAR